MLLFYSISSLENESKQRHRSAQFRREPSGMSHRRSSCRREYSPPGREPPSRERSSAVGEGPIKVRKPEVNLRGGPQLPVPLPVNPSLVEFPESSLGRRPAPKTSQNPSAAPSLSIRWEEARWKVSGFIRGGSCNER